MGSGKTTLGKRLANKLNQPFFDLDAIIEEEENISIAEIFDIKGEAFFRELETKTLARLIDDNEHFVCSLGGGTPCYNNNMELINQSGISFYLKYNSGMLVSRLSNAKSERPLIKGLNDKELETFVSEKLKERELFYNQSNHILEGGNLKVDDLTALIQ